MTAEEQSAWRKGRSDALACRRESPSGSLSDIYWAGWHIGFVEAAPRQTLWSINDALVFTRALEAAIAPHYHVALAGGVLIRGRSDHDLDIVIYPSSSVFRDDVFLLNSLTQLGMIKLRGRDVLTAHWRSKGSTDEKHVETWEYAGKRVDLLLLS